MYGSDSDDQGISIRTSMLRDHLPMQFAPPNVSQSTSSFLSASKIHFKTSNTSSTQTGAAGEPRKLLTTTEGEKVCFWPRIIPFLSNYNAQVIQIRELKAGKYEPGTDVEPGVAA